MRELAKSMFRLSWAASLYGAEQVAGLLRGEGDKDQMRPQGESEIGRSIDELARATRMQLGPVARAAFQAGTELQSELVNAVSDAFSEGGWQGSLECLAERSRASLRFVSPDAEGAITRQEFRNRIEAYRLVIEGRQVHQLPPPGAPFSLTEAVERTFQLDPHRVLWAMEALGHAYAETSVLLDRAPRGLLQDVDSLPRISLPMLHAGMGLGFAEHVLRDVTLRTTEREMRQRLERFVSLCRDNALPSHLGGSLEALGLVARGVHPELVGKLETCLSELGDEELQAYFWHGIGRALYFVPIHLIPGYSSVGHALEMARREAPHELALDNVIAGVAVAAALVNMGHPAVLEHLLREHGDTLRGTSFSDGVISAVIIRHDLTPDRAAVDDFLRYRPNASEPDLVIWWDEVIREPCETLLMSPATHYRQRRLVPFTVLNVEIRSALLAEQQTQTQDATDGTPGEGSTTS